MTGKDKACKCGHNLWKTLKKKRRWQCRGCGDIRDAVVEDMKVMKAQRADNINMVSRIRKVFA